MGEGPQVWLLARAELCPELLPATLRHKLRQAMRAAGVPAIVVEDALLAAQEACNNAIIHAGSEAPPELSVCLIDDHIVVEVGDRGGGFDVDQVRSGWPPNLLEGRGRGLYLIDALSDTWEVRARAPGTIVRMVKRIH